MKISTKVQGLLEDQILHEFTNHAIYMELHAWCAYNGYSNAACLYKKQADDELSHRNKIIKLLLEAGYKIPPLSINKHNIPADNLEKTFKVGLKLEQTTSAKLTELKQVCESSGEHMVGTFLNDLLLEQIEEESIYIDLLDACSQIGLFDTATPEWAKGQMRQLIDNRIS